MGGWTEASLRSDAAKFGDWMQQVEALLPYDFGKEDWIPDPKGAPPPQGQDGPADMVAPRREMFGGLPGADAYHQQMVTSAMATWEFIADGVIDMGLIKAQLLNTVITFMEAESAAAAEIEKVRKEIEGI